MSKGHAAPVEEIYRFVFVMATLAPDQLLGDKRGEQLNKPAAADCRSMAQTMDEKPTTAMNSG